MDETKPNTEIVILSLGSNLGEKKENLLNAINLLSSSGIIKDIVLSSIYITEPVGVKEQGDFYNMALRGNTQHNPLELMMLVKTIEYLMDRRFGLRWGERIIDVDILFYGNQILSTKNLNIPHNCLHERKFVLVPTSEIAKDFIHPIYNKTIIKLLEECKDKSSVVKL